MAAPIDVFCTLCGALATEACIGTAGGEFHANREILAERRTRMGG